MKEDLSKFTEKLFREIQQPGLYVMPLATGGGKSYTIGKLACCYYPKFFRRIVILTIQKKLSLEMQAQLEQSLKLPESLITSSDVLMLNDNISTMNEAVSNGSMVKLISECRQWISKLKKVKRNQQDRGSEVTDTESDTFSRLESDTDCLKSLVNGFKELDSKDKIDVQEQEIRQKLRSVLKRLRAVEKSLTGIVLTPQDVFEQLPSLTKAIPATDWESKRVLYLTVHKAMYGIDPLMGEKVQLIGLGDKGGNLFVLDESDRCGLVMRSIGAQMAIQQNGGFKQSGYGYQGLLSYQRLIDNEQRIDFNYAPDLFQKRMKQIQENNAKRWSIMAKDIPIYNSIYLHASEQRNSFRRGVFFAGPISNLYIRRENDRRKSFILHESGQMALHLVHATQESADCWDENDTSRKWVELPQFLWAAIKNRNSMIRGLSLLSKETYQMDRVLYEAELRRLAIGESFEPRFSYEPSLRFECYTLICRLGEEEDQRWKKTDQIYDYAINRKNIKVKLGDEWKRVPDLSVYITGFHLFEETLDEWDLKHGIQLRCRSMDFTPEKILLSLLSARGDNDDFLKKENNYFANNAVVLSSATALCPSVIANLDIAYLESKLFDRLHIPTESELATYDELKDSCCPEGHRIETCCIPRFEMKLNLPKNRHFPAAYISYMDPEAVKAGLPEQWFRRTLSDWNTKGIEEQPFIMSRLLQFIEVYYRFYSQEGIHSFLFFQNLRGDRYAQHYQILSCLVDGSWTSQSEFPEEELPSDWNNPHLVMTSDWELVSQQVLKRLAGNKDEKLMLVAAYNSFGVGSNLQYEVPEGADVLTGDSWETSHPKKDWDGIYLQMVTHYLTTPVSSDSEEDRKELQIYRTILDISMLYERGYLSEREMTSMLRRALLGGARLSKKQNDAVLSDACYWAQCHLSQAVGRICRTTVKPPVTYLFYDEGICEAFSQPLPPGSYTREFRALAEAATCLPEREVPIHPEEIRRVNDANRAELYNKKRLTGSLVYYHRPDLYTSEEQLPEGMEEESTNEIQYSVLRDQQYRQAFKQVIIKHPVIRDWNDLTESERTVLSFSRFYGDWPRSETNELTYYQDQFHHFVTSDAAGAVCYHLSPDSVRLPQLVANPDIRAYFEAEGIACEWKQEGQILHPSLLLSDYCGEIGEQAFVAICQAIDPSVRERLRPLSMRDYEMADFVLYAPDGTRRLAFDVKNFAPTLQHDDRPGDIPTADKREEKVKRLGCPLYTVNLLELPSPSIDPYEITGLIREDGTYISSNINKLKMLICHE